MSTGTVDRRSKNVKVKMDSSEIIFIRLETSQNSWHENV